MKPRKLDGLALIFLQAKIEDRERNLAVPPREFKDSRLSPVGYENTTVIAADTPPPVSG